MSDTSTPVKRKGSDETLTPRPKHNLSIPIKTVEEAEIESFYIRADVIGTIFMGLVYFMIGNRYSDVTEHLEIMPLHVKFLSVICAVISVSVFFMYVVLMPSPNQETPFRLNVTLGVGRWIFLSRIGLALQMYHLVARAIVAIYPGVPYLASITNGASAITGILGMYLTVQFFRLYYGSEQRRREIAFLSAKTPHTSFIQCFTHVMPAPLALLDATIIQSEAAPWVSYSKIAWTLISICGSYILLMIHNRRQTGMWPHPVFDEMHDSPARWMFFLGRQLFIFTLLDLTLRSARILCGPQWS